jgi:hypothetical protein
MIPTLNGGFAATCTFNNGYQGGDGGNGFKPCWDCQAGTGTTTTCPDLGEFPLAFDWLPGLGLMQKGKMLGWQTKTGRSLAVPSVDRASRQGRSRSTPRALMDDRSIIDHFWEIWDKTRGKILHQIKDALVSSGRGGTRPQ